MWLVSEVELMSPYLKFTITRFRDLNEILVKSG
jgi:hypothetical protein